MAPPADVGDPPATALAERLGHTLHATRACSEQALAHRSLVRGARRAHLQRAPRVPG